MKILKRPSTTTPKIPVQLYMQQASLIGRFFMLRAFEL